VKETIVELGAFVLVPENASIQRVPVFGQTSGSALQSLPLWPVVGKNLIQESVEKIRQIGALVLSVIHSADLARDRVEMTRTLAKQGVEQILSFSLNSYAEIDLAEFVQFHRQKRSLATEAMDAEGPLGVELINRASLLVDRDRSEAIASENASKYHFSGYAKRLRSAQLYRDLVSDALRGQCALRPKGLQIDDSVWIGEETQIAPTVRLFGPCFVGDGVVLRDFVSLGPSSSVENECLIDCGTTVEGSSVLPNTFLAAGLNVRHSIVDGSRLEHLDSGTAVDLQSAALGGRFKSRSKAHRDRDNGLHIPVWSQTSRPAAMISPA
jgi:NDP-sugar pyrophosphorylase family protein